jgi:hypothetical protein
MYIDEGTNKLFKNQINNIFRSTVKVCVNNKRSEEKKDLRRADQRVNLYDVKAEQVNRSTTKVKTLIGSNNVWRPQHFDCRDLLRLRPNFTPSRPKTYSHQALGQYSQLGLLEFLTRRLVKSQKSQVLTI